LTTVGYRGSPQTTLGRIITIGVLVVGIGFVAVLTEAVAQRFLASEIEVLAELREVRARLDRLESRLADRAT
jgi:hypothetical protein